MNLFLEIENKKQETLMCAVLRFLIVSVCEFRDAFIGLLAEAPEPLSCDAHFSIESEVLTEDKEWGKGRIDLVVETEEAVIGVEAKLWADMGEGQPQKYAQTLVEKAKALSKLRGRPYCAYLVVLAPELREDTLKGELEEKFQIACGRGVEKCILVSWEALIGSLEGAGVDRPIGHLVGQLGDYLKAHTGILFDFRSMASQLSAWESKGSKSHRRVVEEMWRLAPDPGSRLSASDSYCGYYFAREIHGWFGFASEAAFLDSTTVGEGAAKFVVTVNGVGDDIVEKSRPPCCLEETGLRWNSKSVSWIVNFDETWGVNQWREVFNFVERLTEHHRSGRQASCGHG